jgi:enoyl-CoA hydratase/carnithine racemase
MGKQMTHTKVCDSGQVRMITLNRPGSRNAMNTELIAELLDLFAAAVASDDVRVIVLTGAGAAFSAGADIREKLDNASSIHRMDLFGSLYEAVACCPKVTLAAVAGHCIGAGIEVAAATDIRIADRTASFRFPGAALDFPVGAAKLTGLVGLGTAKELVFSSRTFGADEAHRVGFVQRIVANGQAPSTAVELGETIAGHGWDSIRSLKRMFLSFSGLADRVRQENFALGHAIRVGINYSA